MALLLARITKENPMPEGLAAPAAPAAAAPSAPAPAAAPSAPAAPAPAPAAEPAAPAAAPVVPGADAPADGGAAAPAAPAVDAEPQQGDFPGDVVGFLEAHNAWERKRDGIDDAPAAPAADAQATADQTAPQDQQQPAPADSELAMTPETLNALAQKSPALQAAIDASPEVKNALFAMARTNAKAAPLLEIFPNKEAAEFAAQTSNTMVNLRTSFLEAVDNPESFPAAFESFADEFAVKDAEGKPVLDAQGNPTYGDDFQMLNDFIVDTYHDVEISDLEAAQQSGKFAAGDGSADDMALQALKYLKDWKTGKTDSQKPDLSGLSPEARAYYEQKDRELAEREAALGDKGKQQSSEQRRQERANYELSVQKKVGSSVGGRLKAMVDEDAKAGVFLPSYVLEAKDPQTGISVFAKSLLDTFEEKTYGRVDSSTGKIIGGVAYIRDQAKMLARRPPSPEAEKARIDFLNKLVDDHLPAIYDSKKREIQQKEIADRTKRQGNQATREQLAEREPRAGGGVGTQKPATAQEAMAEAYKWVDSTSPDLSPTERTEKALIRKNEIMGNRY